MPADLQTADDEVEEEWDDCEEVDQVHRRHQESQLPRAARQSDLKNHNLFLLDVL